MGPFRIFEEGDEHEPVVALHGWLTVEQVGELAKVVAGKGPRLRIDISQLRHADHEGVRALQRLRDGGATVSGGSPFVLLLLG